jgi:hypothetical protein
MWKKLALIPVAMALVVAGAMFGRTSGVAINYPGFGYLYFATTLEVTPDGCPAGEYRLATGHQWGQAVTLSSAPCVAPVASGPGYAIDLDATVSGLSAAKGLFNPVVSDFPLFNADATGLVTPRPRGRSFSCSVHPDTAASTGGWIAECDASAPTLASLLSLLDLPSLESAPSVWMRTPP